MDIEGTIQTASDSPSRVLGFKPDLLIGRNLNEVLDVFQDLPIRAGPAGSSLDVMNVLEALIDRWDGWRVC